MHYFFPSKTFAELAILSNQMNYVMIHFLSQLSAKGAQGLVDWSEKSLLILVGGIVGVIGKYLQEEVSERMASVEKIWEKVEKGKPLRIMQERRIGKETLRLFELWEKALTPPAGSTKQINALSNTGAGEKNKLSIPLDMPVHESLCPTDSGEHVLYFNTYDLAPGRYEISVREEIPGLIEKKLQQLKDDHHLSGKLIKRYLDPALGKTLFIWIKIPNYRVRNDQDVKIMLGLLSNQIKNTFTDFALITEMYYPKDIGQDPAAVMFMPDDINPMFLKIEELKDFICWDYTIKRNIGLFSLMFRKRLGELNQPKLKIPEDVLSEKAERLGMAFRNSGSWTFSVQGRPGTGKTEAVDLFLDKASREKTATLYIICNQPELILFLEGIERIFDRESFIRGLLFCGPDAYSESLIPDNIPSGILAREAFADALVYRLINQESPLTLIIDDLDALTKLKMALNNSKAKFMSWKIRLIAISRSGLPGGSNKEMLYLAPWKADEAHRILLAWNPGIDTSETHVQMMLKQNQEILSSYLLRIIANRNGDSKSIDKMLGEELEEILEPFQDMANKASQSADTLLAELKSKIEQDKPNSDLRRCFSDKPELSVINIFSSLAWHSKFNMTNANLSRFAGTDNDQEYKSGLINYKTVQNYLNISDFEAKDFLSECINSKIFGGSTEYAYWQDNLIADGCIALELKNNITERSDSEIIWPQLYKLLEGDALDFFKFIIDIGTIDNILQLKPPGEQGSNLGIQVIQELVTEDIIKRISVDEIAFNHVVDSLFAFCERLKTGDRLPVLKLLAEFYPFSRNLKSSLSSPVFIKKHIEVSLGVLSINLSKSEFVETYREEHRNNVLTAICTYWTIDDQALMQKFILENFEDDDLPFVQTELSKWIKEQTMASLKLQLTKVIEAMRTGKLPKQGLLVVDLLLNSYLQGIKLLVREHAKGFNQIKTDMIELLKLELIAMLSETLDKGQPAERGTKKRMDLLINYLCYFLDPGLVTEGEAEFLIQKIGSSGYVFIPKLPLYKKTMPEIKKIIQTGYPRLKLAASAQLRSVVFLENEFVSDGFPSDFDYQSDRIIAGHCYKSWDGEKLNILESIASNGVELNRFRWRFALSVDASSPSL